MGGCAKEAPGLPHTWPLNMEAVHVPGLVCPRNRSSDLFSAVCLSYRWTNRNRAGGGGGGEEVGAGGSP